MVYYKSTHSQHSRIYLLGDFRIEWKAQAVRLPTRKTESLLAYLILKPGAHHRDKLAAEFWGDVPEVHARVSLRKALAILHKALDDEIVLADRETVRINPAVLLWVDVFELEQQAHQFFANPSPELHQIDCDLYHGDLLTNHYDDWIIPLREHYRLVYVDIILRFVEILRAKSEYKTASHYAQRALEHDPANERAFQHLMFCHVVLGDRHGALKQYQACQRALQDELGVEPARETQALYNWLKQSESPSLATRLTNLPISISSFIGRERELAAIKQIISHTRLVTLTGAGGSGKTRLAIHAAIDLIDSFKDGIWWVELAPLSDPVLVPTAVAKALGLNAQPEHSLTETLAQYLNTRQILIILDNCEHLIEACARLAEHLLNSCQNLNILTTSRESLGLIGETVWHVPTMSLPETQDVSISALLMQYEGIRLFVERAITVSPNFTLDEDNANAIVQICQRLDGIPLAIELAAARVKFISVEQIAARLDDRFRLLSAINRTVQARHQTLRAAIDWSYSLLSEAECSLFARLSIFSGGWTLDAAESVCQGNGLGRDDILPLLARLVDKSLVVNHTGQRYRMLETIRQYTGEKLTQFGQQEIILSQHIDYFLRLAVIGDEKVRGPEQYDWIRKLDAERDNFAGAMERALESPVALEKGCELVSALTWYWGLEGDFIQAKHWLELALSHSSNLGQTPTRARLLFSAGSLSVWGLNLLKSIEACQALEESLELWRTLGPEYLHETGKCLFTLGWVRKLHFNQNAGYDDFHEGLKILEVTGQIWWQAWALNIYEFLIWKHRSRTELIEREAALWEKAGDSFGQAHPLFSLGIMALERGDYSNAREYLAQSLQIFEQFSAKGYILQLKALLGDAARGLNQYDQAKLDYQECLALIPETMLFGHLPPALCGLGYVELHEGAHRQAESYFQQALQKSRELKLRGRENLCVAGLAAVEAVRGRYCQAARLFGAFSAQIEVRRRQMQSDQNLVDPADQLEIDYHLDLCRAHLSPEAFNASWEQGQNLTWEQVLAEILPTE